MQTLTLHAYIRYPNNQIPATIPARKSNKHKCARSRGNNECEMNEISER